MARAYQAFNLNEEAQDGVDKKKTYSRCRGDKLVKKLRERGYAVLISSSGVEDIPLSIIVVAQSKEKQNSMLRDFHNVTSQLGLSFEDGNLYFEP